MEIFLSRILLKLFGYPVLLRNGEPVGFNRHKAMALLAYLAVTRERHSRDALATLLWPDTGSDRAHANLRNVFYSIKQSEAREVLSIDRSSAAFSKDPSTQVDVLEFMELSTHNTRCDHSAESICPFCVERFTAAADLFRDSFLSGFLITDSSVFEQWQLLESQSLQHEHTKTLEKLIRYYENRQDWAMVIDYLKRLVVQDSLNETNHRRLMTVFARTGNKTEALRQYSDCCRLLRNELETEPDEETKILLEKIRSGCFDNLPTREMATRAGVQVPCYPTPFVGRIREKEDLQAVLRDPDRRIVTLTGPGGSGKTRLALEVIRHIAGHYPDGIVWIPLTSVESPDFFLSAIAGGLNLKIARVDPGIEYSNLVDVSELKAQITMFLQNRKMLLIMDGFEHLVEASAMIAEIVATAPYVQFLVTSRERLNLQGEWVVETTGLSYPENDSEEVYNRSDAVTLFTETARRVWSGFEMTPDNRSHIGRICRLVQGIPLAIDLAAAWVKVMNCREIAVEIASNLDFLSSAMPDIPERHRSIRAVFDQTWQMLSETGRMCFQTLTVFRGGFSREAARTITGATDGILVELLDKSVLRRMSGNRFVMHDLLRQYAAHKLCQQPAAEETVRTRHMEFYLGLLSDLEMSLRCIDQKQAIRTISGEIENIRTAWLLAASRGDVGCLMDTVMSLFLYYDLKGQFQDGFEIYRKAFSEVKIFLQDNAWNLQVCRENPEILAGLLLGIQGWFLRYSQPVILHWKSEKKVLPVEAFDLADAGLKYLNSYRSSPAWAMVTVLTIFLKSEFIHEEAKNDLDACLDVFMKHQDQWGIAMTYHAMGCWYWHCDKMKAQEFQKKSLDVRQQAGDDWGTATSLYILGFDARCRNNLHEAKQLYLKSLAIRRQLEEDHNGLIESLEKLGCVSFMLEEYEDSFRFYRECLSLSRTMTNFYRTASILGTIGAAYFKLGQHSPRPPG